MFKTKLNAKPNHETHKCTEKGYGTGCSTLHANKFTNEWDIREEYSQPPTTALWVPESGSIHSKCSINNNTGTIPESGSITNNNTLSPTANGEQLCTTILPKLASNPTTICAPSSRSMNDSQDNICIMAANANSLKNKVSSLLFNIEQLKPQIIVIQETKFKKKNQIELKGYRVFPTIRGDNGGGILIACLTSLEPVLVHEGDSENEFIVVQVKLKNKHLRIIGGYGPQECAPVVVRESYRNNVEAQIVRAHLSGCMVLVAEDANAKLGKSWIKGDSHDISENGKLLAGMITRQNLVIINNDEKCTGGPVTRCRTVEGKREESCIDYIMASEDLAQNLDNALIDSKQLYSLTKYTTTKGVTSIKRSDHYTFIANFLIEWEVKKLERVEVFKLRDEEGLKKFNDLTSKESGLNRCIDSPNMPLEEACSKWYKSFDKLLHQCFTKVRITDTPPKNSLEFPIHQIMADNKILKELLASASEMCKGGIEQEIASNESKLAQLLGQKCKETINESVSKLSTDGTFNANAAWKMKKKLYPKCSEEPFAVFNTNHQLITDAVGILDVMNEEFVYRLRNRVIDGNYGELKEIKEYLCKMRLELTKKSDFVPWTMDNLKKAIGKLKRNKCKDPHGHINELYMYLGISGLHSLLLLLNRIKDELLVPLDLKLSNVSTIYKGKGSRKDVINLRGIFKLPIVRNILDKLVHIEDQDQINTSMGPFQVGNHKERGIRDHTLIIHAVIQDAKARNLEIDIQFTDIKQCFDSVWLEDAINDLYDSGITSRNLNILYEGNTYTDMCVENKLGKSSRSRLTNIVMQGSVSGGTLCSNQLSKLCNATHNEGVVYMYGGSIPIPALAMVDDLASISLCTAVDSTRKNIKTDEFIKSKKLESQVGEGKCQWIHSGKTPCNSSYVASGKEISQCSIYKYLGDFVSDGFDPLYLKRLDKCKGYAVTCQAMCTEMSLGNQMYSITKLLHQAVFLNGTMVNMETWPLFNEERVNLYEKVEQGLIRAVLSAHSKTPVELLYLELGIVPFRFHLMSRRVMYFHTIVNRSNDDLTKMVVFLQKEKGIRGDFYHQVEADLQKLDITQEDVQLKNKESLKEIVKIHENALDHLLRLATNHSKSRNELYTSLNGMEYFHDSRFTTEMIKLLFKFRTRMFAVRNNFRNKYLCTLCPLCAQCEDSQQHLLECPVVRGYHNTTILYNDIFTNDNDKLLIAAKELMKIVKIREELLPQD